MDANQLTFVTDVGYYVSSGCRTQIKGIFHGIFRYSGLIIININCFFCCLFCIFLYNFDNFIFIFSRFLENYTKSKNLQESSKDSLSRELRHMDHQIALMDELALKMEAEYHRTKLVRKNLKK